MKYYMSYVDVEIVNKSPFPLPEYKTEHAAGMDVQADLSNIGVEKSHFSSGELELRFAPGQTHLIPTGLFVSIPEGYEIQVRPRSGLSVSTKLRVANTPGTIDADYRGEIKVILENVGDEWERISHGDRIAQLVLCPVMRACWVEAKDLPESTRGTGGFGSTGLN